MCVPIDSQCHKVIHRALADLPSGRLGSFRKQVVCTLALPNSADTLRHCPPIPHDATLQEMIVETIGHIERPERAMDVSQAPRSSGNMRTRCPSQSHYGCQAGLLGTWAVSTRYAPITPLHQQPKGLGCQELASLAPEPRQSPAPECLPQPPEHWNLSLIGDPDSPPQDRTRQPVILILDAEERGFTADPADWSRTRPPSESASIPPRAQQSLNWWQQSHTNANAWAAMQVLS